MSEWKEYKLGDICADVAMGPFGSNLKTDNFISSGVPVIRGGNLNENGFENDKFVFVSDVKAQSLKRSLAFPNELVFTHRGTIGQVAIIPEDKYPYYLVSQSQVRLKVNDKYLCPKFLFYWFKSATGQYELLKNSAQVGVPSIASPTRSLKEIDIKIPSLPTQQSIASILSSLDDKIELNNAINKNLEALAQALFKRWFVDFEFPFDFAQGKPNEEGQPYKSSGGEMVESELG
jgi:type I restriction enzyme, S subunit